MKIVQNLIFILSMLSIAISLIIFGYATTDKQFCFAIFFMALAVFLSFVNVKYTKF